MKNLLMRMYVWGQIVREDKGQDLIEYALVAALIAFAAVAGMNDLAKNINSAFNQIGTKLSSAMAT